MTKEEALLRIREIRREAKDAKSDAILWGLKSESDALISEFGEQCKKCGKKHLALKYGYCFDCAMDMGIG